MIKRNSIIGVLLFFGTLAAAMGAKPEDLQKYDGKMIRVRGTLSIVGNEPFTKMAVRITNDRLIYLSAADKKTYNNLIASSVDAEGILRIETVYSANKKYRFMEYHLSNAAVRRAVDKITPPAQTN